jgi:lysophospholipase L1-like esterase
MIRGMARVASRFWLWRLPAAVAVLATLLFGAGFWLALRGVVGRPLGAAPPAPQSSVLPTGGASGRLLLVLGDSLARGTGDETGRGFVADVLDGLRKKGGKVEVANLSVNGAESSEVRELVDTANVRSLAASAAWILVSVGGNDLSHAVPRGSDSPAGPLESVAQARNQYAANLRAILGSLREASPTAPIRVLGLYDPFERAATSRLGASVILGWNHLIEETALSEGGALVVPTFDLFEGREDRLALDHFHPNRAGYAAIATRILQGID